MKRKQRYTAESVPIAPLLVKHQPPFWTLHTFVTSGKHAVALKQLLQGALRLTLETNCKKLLSFLTSF